MAERDEEPKGNEYANQQHPSGEGEAWTPERCGVPEMEERFGKIIKQYGRKMKDGRHVEMIVFEELYVLVCFNPENKARYFQAQLSPESMFLFRFMYDFLCDDLHPRDEMRFREALDPEHLREWDEVLRDSFQAVGEEVPTVRLDQIYTEPEIEQIKVYYGSFESNDFRRMVKTEIIEPQRARITASIGEFDADFIAYATEHIFNVLAEAHREHEQPAGTKTGKAGH